MIPAENQFELTKVGFDFLFSFHFHRSSIFCSLKKSSFPKYDFNVTSLESYRTGAGNSQPTLNSKQLNLLYTSPPNLFHFQAILNAYRY